MKKSATITLVTLLVITMIIPQSLAITSQGLFYRMEDGNRFYFSMEVTSEGETGISEIVFVEIEDSNKPIPDPLTNLTDLDHLDKGLYFENGTDMGLHALAFAYLARFEFPVGDWDLISTRAGSDLASMLIPSAEDILIFSEADQWGYTYWFNSSIDTEFGISAFYSKFDGLLQHYMASTVNTTTYEVASHYELTRISQHNFMWGFDDGDRFDFNLTITGNALSFHNVSEQFYLEVAEDGLEIFPYSVTEFDDIPFFGADVYWMNGTEIYAPFLSHSWRLAVPMVGNTSLHDDLIAASSSSVNVTVDDSILIFFWGYSRNDTVGDVLIEIHTDYLKTDGFLAHHTATFTNTTSSEVVGTLSVTRIGLPEPTTTITTWLHDDGIVDLIMDNLLYIGVGVVLILGLIVLIRKR
ncbi:MAG: hypothetical protein ACW98U_13020 [Candidatus Thorarchaeota archaeon]